jgi:hypothetical protein
MLEEELPEAGGGCVGFVPAFGLGADEGLPRETVMNTLDPRFSFSPAFGDWATTVPGASSFGTRRIDARRSCRSSVRTAAESFKPVMSGTTTGGGCETSSRTVSPLCSFSPAAGRSPTTSPSRRVEATCATVAVRPASFSAATARGNGSPISLGTAIVAVSPVAIVAVSPVPERDVDGVGAAILGVFGTFDAGCVVVGCVGVPEAVCVIVGFACA